MDLSIGTEVRDKYLKWEVAAGARKLIEDIMLIQEGDHVVISADTSSDMRVVQASARAVFTKGAVPSVVLHPTQDISYSEPPPPVAGAIQNADVWIEYAVGPVFLSKAWREALEKGVRYICLTGMDVPMMVNTIQRVRYAELLALGNLLRDTIQEADKVEIFSSNGTELIAYNQGRRARQTGKLADTKGEAVMLGGQVSWCPIEETINGKLVFDGAIYPPAALGKLKESVELSLKDGIVQEVHGGAEASVYEKWLARFGDPNMYRLAHYSLGFNPGVARPTDRIVEAERMFGSVVMGIGKQGPQIMGKTWDAATHSDGIVMYPTIVLDGVVLEEDGVYTMERVVQACKELGAPGY